jgi:hypothetical protein
MMNDFKRGDVVRVLQATGLGKTDADAAALQDRIGVVTGRGIADFIEVNIAGGVVPRMFGYLLRPEELERVND